MPASEVRQRNPKKSRRSKSQKSSAKRDEPAISYLHVIGVVVLVFGGLPAVLLGADRLSKALGVGLQQLSTDDTALMKRVFFSGEPWLILCKPTVRPKNPDSAMEARAVESLFEGVLSKSKELSAEATFNVAMLNCSQTFPSGKTVYQRFRLPNRRREHTAFLVSNGESPRVIPQQLVFITPSSDKDAMVDELVSFVGYSARVPKLRKVDTRLNFRAQCLRKKACALVMFRKWDDATKAMVERTRLRYRAVTFALMNWTKHSLSFENKLPPVADAPADEPRLLFFRKPTKEEYDAPALKAKQEAAQAAKDGKKVKPKRVVRPKVAAKAFRKRFTESNVVEFIELMLSKTPVEKGGPKMALMTRFPGLSNREAVRRAKELRKKREEEAEKRRIERQISERKAKRKRAKEQAIKKIQGDKGTGDEEPKGNEALWEAQRRAEMEAEEMENTPQEMTPEEVELLEKEQAAADAAENDDDDVIDLDDSGDAKANDGTDASNL